MRATLTLERAAVEVGQPQQHRQQPDAYDRERDPHGRARPGHVRVAGGDEAEHEPQQEEDQHGDGRRNDEHHGRLPVAAAREIALAELRYFLAGHIAPEPEAGACFARSGSPGFSSTGRQRTTGRFAAPASSSRRTGVVCGALLATSGSSFASSRIERTTSAKWSSRSFTSVSVGSIISASSTSSGKYTVGGCTSWSSIRLAMSSVLIPSFSFAPLPETTNSCMQVRSNAIGRYSAIPGSASNAFR